MANPSTASGHDGRPFNPYLIMWVMVFFDLPVQLRKQRKEATRFRKDLLQAGFDMFQFSIYIRHCLSRDQADRHILKVESILPPEGQVGIMMITDKQFGQIHLYRCAAVVATKAPPQQLEMF
jgi:CRISPR-associated protein Cas2